MLSFVLNSLRYWKCRTLQLPCNNMDPALDLGALITPSGPSVRLILGSVLVRHQPPHILLSDGRGWNLSSLGALCNALSTHMSYSQYQGYQGHVKDGRRILYGLEHGTDLQKSSYRMHVLRAYQKHLPKPISLKLNCRRTELSLMFAVM